MKYYALCTCLALTTGCGAPAFMALKLPDVRKLSMLSGESAMEPAALRIVLVDKTRTSNHYRVQSLPGAWESACLCLQSGNRLTAPRSITLNRTSDFNGSNTTKSAAFTYLRPGNYIFQVSLMMGPNATGESAAVHTVNLTLAGGTNTAITVTMKTTDGADAAHGGTVLNSTISDSDGYVRCGSTNYNSILSSSGFPVIVAGDSLLIEPSLSDSTATGSSTVMSGGSSTTTLDTLDPGVLSRVVLSYASAGVTPTGPALVPGEVYLTDWVRNGNEPIRNIPWSTLANGTDGDDWPAGSSDTRTGTSTFSGNYTWNTTPEMFPLSFSDESSLSENYRLVFRYYDNTTNHRLITIKTRPLAIVAPASIGLTVN